MLIALGKQVHTMADSKSEQVEIPKKASKKPLIFAFCIALTGGGGGFFAAYSGMMPGYESGPDTDSDHVVEMTAKIGELPDVAYVPIEPLVISLGDGANGAHLRFRAQLEVKTKYKSDVEQILPRVVDVLNSYLRALETRDLSDSTALIRLRSQMLRRVQIVTGGERVNDLLIMEFVLN